MENVLFERVLYDRLHGGRVLQLAEEDSPDSGLLGRKQMAG